MEVDSHGENSPKFFLACQCWCSFWNEMMHVTGVLLQHSYFIGNGFRNQLQYLKHSIDIFCVNYICFLCSPWLGSLFCYSLLPDTSIADAPMLYCIALRKARPAFSCSLFKTEMSQPWVLSPSSTTDGAKESDPSNQEKYSKSTMQERCKVHCVCYLMCKVILLL
jgi:hypothetical protein